MIALAQLLEVVALKTDASVQGLEASVHYLSATAQAYCACVRKREAGACKQHALAQPLHALVHK
jgi:acetaldehyde dehydrogenase (acetylating)